MVNEQAGGEDLPLQERHANPARAVGHCVDQTATQQRSACGQMHAQAQRHRGKGDDPEGRGVEELTAQVVNMECQTNTSPTLSTSWR